MQLPFSKLVIASGNTGKIRELQHLLQSLHLEIVPQSSLDVPEAEEPYATFIENALTKARHASSHTGLPAIADDSGLCVDALNGSPGVLSARYACEDPSTPKSDARNNSKLLQVMANQDNRHAHFYCVIVLVRHANDPEPIIAEGLWPGEILNELRGDYGFGYDPLFVDAKTGKTAAELPLDIKSRISHRGHAMAKLLQKLERLAL